ncbi:hypothetical protein [Paraburkholderia ultramafica]|uniref:hypothetical protein n=1 Tax=Paraburkholderia ultramafica TaxID=1544867 RepID=UPI00158285D6|nr:hypothetical protein [Paraburkholderia ultramafica]
MADYCRMRSIAAYNSSYRSIAAGTVWTSIHLTKGEAAACIGMMESSLQRGAVQTHFEVW